MMKKYFDNLYTGTKSDFFFSLKENLANGTKTFVITANPEAFICGEKDSVMDKMLTDKSVTVVADGIGIVKGANILGIDIKERIPGIDIATELLYLCNELQKSLFLFGAKPEVISALKEKIKNDFPNIEIKGTSDGYVSDKDSAFGRIKELSPDAVLVALGIPEQEKLIYRHLSEFNKGIFVGVGGSFDVLSGSKKRAPEFFIKHNLEWLYRIAKEPKRLKRFYENNVKFILKIKKIHKRSNLYEN